MSGVSINGMSNLSNQSGSDKLYIVVILVMVGIFIYWYQNKSIQECQQCKKRYDSDKKKSAHISKKHRSNKGKQKDSCQENMGNREKKKKRKHIKSVSFKEDEVFNDDDTVEDENNSKYQKKRKLHKNRRQEDEESEISLDSLDSSDHASMEAEISSKGGGISNGIKNKRNMSRNESNEQNDDSDDSDSLDSLDI